MSDKLIGGEPLRCAQCGLPYARIQGKTLIIESKHRGKVHVNVIAISELVRLSDNDDQSAGRLASNGH